MASTIEKIIAYGEANGIEIGRAEGRKEGRLEGKKELIISILQTGKYSLAELAGLSGLSLDEVKALQESISGKG